MIITTTTEGRLLTLINRSGSGLGVVGVYLKPGQSKDIRLATVQESSAYMEELENHVAAGRLALAIDGVPVTDTTSGDLDAPLDAPLVAARDVWPDVAVADVDAIKTAFAAPAADTTYYAADFDGDVGAGTMLPPRNITFTGTCGAGEALDGGTATVVGLDIDGVIRTESVTLSAVGGSSTNTDEGAIAFQQILEITIPADASGTPGDYEIGFGNSIGFSKPLTQGIFLKEFVDNAEPTNAGSVVLAASSLPNGTYVPHSTEVPDDSKDYVLVYVPN